MINHLLSQVFKADIVLSIISLILILFGHNTLSLIPLILMLLLYVSELSFGMTFLKKTQNQPSSLKVKQRKLINLSNTTGVPLILSMTIPATGSKSLLAQIALFILLVLVLGFSIYELIFIQKNKA